MRSGQALKESASRHSHTRLQSHPWEQESGSWTLQKARSSSLDRVGLDGGIDGSR